MDSKDEENKFNQLYQKYKNLMYYIANGVLHNSSSAEEIVHDSFEKVLKILHRIDDVNSTKTKNLVATITYRLALNVLKKKRKRDEILIKNIGILWPTQFYASAADHLMEKEAHRELTESILKLPGHYSDILFLKYDNGLSDREIAEVLDMSVSNVRKTAQRAKAALAKQLELEKNGGGNDGTTD